MASPESTAKVPDPSRQVLKRKLLRAMELECELLQNLALAKRKRVADKAFKAARAVAEAKGNSYAKPRGLSNQIHT